MQSPRIIPAARVIPSREGKPADPFRPIRRPHLGLTAGLTAFALLLSLAIPVTARADDNGVTAALKKAPLVMEVRDDRWPHDGKGWGKGRDKPRKAVPSVCAVEIDGRGGSTWYSERCIRDHGIRADLPRGCATGARILGQRDRLYTPKCLRGAGLSLPR